MRLHLPHAPPMSFGFREQPPDSRSDAADLLVRVIHAPRRASMRPHVPPTSLDPIMWLHQRVSHQIATHGFTFTRLTSNHSSRLHLHAPHWIATLRSYSPFYWVHHTRSHPLNQAHNSYPTDACTKSRPFSQAHKSYSATAHTRSKFVEKKKTKRKRRRNTITSPSGSHHARHVRVGFDASP